MSNTPKIIPISDLRQDASGIIKRMTASRAQARAERRLKPSPVLRRCTAT